MEEHNLQFCSLVEGVLAVLKEQHYMDSTLMVYRRVYDRVHLLMSERGTEIYTKEIGQEFLDSVEVCYSTFKEYSCAIRRLDDHIEEKPYRLQRGNQRAVVAKEFADVLSDYLANCKELGNKPATLCSKERVCTLFLNHIEQEGCTDVAKLDADLVLKSLLIFTNKNNYDIVCLFLKYLADAGITQRDFSGIVPRYRRRKPLPTTYTPSEIMKIEGAAEKDPNAGTRNLAIIRLATRMGLRSGDIVKLKWSEIDFENETISIIQEKTGTPLSLQMPEDVSSALLSLFDHCSIPEDEYVFHRMRAPYGRVSTSAVRHALNSYFKAAGVDTVGKKHGPHAFRSSLASSMVNDNVSYETVRKILGHSDPNMIKHYAKTDIEKLRTCAIEPPTPSGRFSDILSGRRTCSDV